MTKETENELYCDRCEEKITNCAACGKEFTVGDIIYCFYDGSDHYCGDSSLIYYGSNNPNASERKIKKAIIRKEKMV